MGHYILDESLLYYNFWFIYIWLFACFNVMPASLAIFIAKT